MADNRGDLGAVDQTKPSGPPLPLHRDRDPMSPCWVHDMAASRDHLVILETPLYIRLVSLLVGRPCPSQDMNDGQAWPMRCMS